MADLLIKGFGLPKNGHNSFLIITADGDVYEKTENRQEDEKIVAHYELLEGVKAIELPTHGRLIDADEIVYEHTVARSRIDGHNWDEVVVTRDQIDDMPTIVEAT